MHRKALAASALVAALTVAGCGQTSLGPVPARPGAEPAGAGSTVQVGPVDGLGSVLVTSDGYPLYMFPPDQGRAVTCTGACAGTWPPMRLPDGETPVAGSGVQVALLGTVEAPEGGRVVTYSGWPLYTYVDDAVPGQATGQALDLNGAPWYVLRPSGELVVPAGSSSMGGTS